MSCVTPNLSKWSIGPGRNAEVHPATVRIGKSGETPLEDVGLPWGRMYWTFTSGGFEGQEVLPTLRNYYNHLLKSVIPKAESLLT